MEVRILEKFKIYPEDINLTVSPISTRKTNAQLEEEINKAWDERVNKETSSGKKIWNSKTYRLNSYSYNKKLNIELGPSEFKYASVSKSMSFFNAVSSEYFPKNLFCASNIKTNDGKYILGSSENTIHDSHILVIGGVYSSDEMKIKNGYDIFENMYKEISEELNLSKDSVKDIYLSGLILSEGGNIGLIFNIDLNINSKETEQIFNIHNDGEIEKLIFVDSDEYKKYMDSFRPQYKYLLSQLIHN